MAAIQESQRLAFSFEPKEPHGLPRPIRVKLTQIRLLAALTAAMASQRRINGARYFERGMFDADLYIEGVERIPCTGPLAVASNHDNGNGKNPEGTSFWQGFDQIAAVTETVSHARSDTIHWLQASTPKNGWLNNRFFHTEELYARFGQSASAILVDRNRPSLNALIAMRRIWKQGGIVGIHPEADAGRRLHQVDARAAFLLDALGERGLLPPVIPIASWKENETFIVRVGNQVVTPENGSLSHAAMVSLARLLPPHKQGYYLLGITSQPPRSY